ncbi:MAG: ABC transporter permease, partial [Clostridiaceae bacterium]|nr:ABC transporter permease [Clostridiaceae bacterium]
MKTIRKDVQAFKLTKKIAIITFICYFLFAGIFYYLAGQELHFRQSRGNINLPTATSGAIELIKGSSVEQEFVSKIQILQGISVQMGTYMRQNTGTVNFELKDLETGNILFEKHISAKDIREGKIVDLPIGKDIEGTYGHKLKLSIYSRDSISGNAVSPLINSGEKNADSQLYFNEKPVNGTLCFTAYGKDHVWTGLYYKQIVMSGACVLVCIILTIVIKIKINRRSYILNLFHAVNKYKFLIQQLVSRDFKTKYKRSILGVFWSFLNPLLMMAVQYFIFSTIFKADIP